MRSVKVYIAGPYSTGDVGENVHIAMRTWAMLWDLGYIPYCPHWTHFQHCFIPRTYEEWLEFDAAWIENCDVILRLPGPSKGADSEVATADALSIPVANGMQELIDRFPANGKFTTRQGSPA